MLGHARGSLEPNGVRRGALAASRASAAYDPGSAFAIFKLTHRPGGDCGTGTGHHARTAIRVLKGKIVEWYRLPDDPNAPLPEPDAPQAEPQPPAGPII